LQSFVLLLLLLLIIELIGLASAFMSELMWCCWRESVGGINALNVRLWNRLLWRKVKAIYYNL